ncbi:cyclophilin-like fold protein [Anaerolentibacter hominis]|uniref:cyclophilin-like fold protein n=1 Tax=Anaerolentibacter hominis TaxID=3079009 RepID=UPI0031B848BE
MKRQSAYLLSLMLAIGIILTGCSNSSGAQSPSPENSTASPGSDTQENTSAGEPESVEDELPQTSELEVQFGDDGETFLLYLEENDTAAAIARHVGTTDWRLPIYHYDDYDNWESMQYYDIPDRYEIPSDPSDVSSAKAGEVYYSDPNRIVLFYHDAEVTGEYTLIGHFEASDGFIEAVESNPVLEGWGNKIIKISAGA